MKWHFVVKCKICKTSLALTKEKVQPNSIAESKNAIMLKDSYYKIARFGQKIKCKCGSYFSFPRRITDKTHKKLLKENEKV